MGFNFPPLSVKWVMPRRVIELSAYWRDQLRSRNILKAWRMAPLCLMSSIWEEWNVRNFEARKTSAEEQTNFMFKISLYMDSGA
jgi:hypothetical protein